MKTVLAILSFALLVASIAIIPSVHAKSECLEKRAAAEKQVRAQEGQPSGLAILVPNCNEDGTYATLQCHHKSNFCQCWDKEGLPITSPKKNLKKCSCLMDRSKALKSIPPSQTDIPEITSCETDGNYSPKQCDRTSCWCVNPDTGKKLGSESKDKSKVRC